MFVVKPKTRERLMQALFILSYYKVSFQAISDGMSKDSVFLIVDTELREHDLRMCEMGFQMEFNQVGRVCPVCKDEGEDICGHLTFE